MTTTAKPTGTCPVCRKERALKKDGTIWTHGICKGAGQKPTTATKPSCTCGEGAATLHWSNCQLYTSQLLPKGK
jgi:hypothetical protein